MGRINRFNFIHCFKKPLYSRVKGEGLSQWFRKRWRITDLETDDVLLCILGYFSSLQPRCVHVWPYIIFAAWLKQKFAFQPFWLLEVKDQVVKFSFWGLSLDLQITTFLMASQLFFHLHTHPLALSSYALVSSSGKDSSQIGLRASF